jgi:uncharacterized protein (DUF58 family)
MLANTLREVHYRLTAPARGAHPGQHRSHSGHSGMEFRSHAAWIDAPQARRVDVLASLRDPHERWLVRLQNQRLAAPVVVLADLSASMAFAGPPSRMQVLADISASLAHSAWRAGDRFGFVGAGKQVQTAFTLPPTRVHGAGLALAQRLREHTPTGLSARGLLQAAQHLPRQRSLVFLVSDFHWPLADVDAVLASLSAHQVVPVVLWGRHEFELSAAHGLAHVLEPESGARRWLWWRDSLRTRWRDAHSARQKALWHICRSQGREPLLMTGAYDADAVTRYFLS